MNGVDIGDLGGGYHCRNVQVAVSRARRADADGFIGKSNVQRITVGFTVDGNCANAEFTACVEHAQRDLTAIGNQDLTKHSDPF